MSLSAENVRMSDGLYRLSYEGVPHPGNTVLKVEVGAKVGPEPVPQGGDVLHSGAHSTLGQHLLQTTSCNQDMIDLLLMLIFRL